MHLSTYTGLLAAGTCILSSALTWLCIRLSKRFGLAADPRSDRWHKLPTPNTGGVAIFISCAVACFFVRPGHYTVIAAAAAAMVFFGFLDDRVQLGPLVKVGGQSIAVLSVIMSGVVLHVTGSQPVNILVTYLWITGVTNAFNLIDNMDGLCAGVTVIICVFRFCSALQTGDASGAAILAVLAGGFLGFLVFNYKPAKIFMGDAGSMFAGFTLSSLAIAAPVPQTRVFVSAILYPVLTFLYPIFDTVLVSVLRKLAGRPISVGGRDHSSHRLASLGLREQNVVWLLWLLTAMGGAGGLLTYSMPFGIWAVAFFLALAITIFGIFLASLPGYELPLTSLASPLSLRRYVPSLRNGITVLVDVHIAGISLLLAFLLKWEDAFPGHVFSEFISLLPIVMVCQAMACLALRSFNLGWRWIGLDDVLAVGRCVLFSSGLSVLITLAFNLHGYSRGVALLYTLLSFCSMTGYRALFGLFWRVLGSVQNGRRAALLGAVQASELLILILQRNKQMNASPILVLDADPSRCGTRIHGIPVVSADFSSPQLLRDAGIDLLILSSAEKELTSAQQTAINACHELGIQILQFEWQCSLQALSPPDLQWNSSLASSAAASA